MLSKLRTSTRLWMFALFATISIATVGLMGIFSLINMGHLTHNNVLEIELESKSVIAIETAKVNLLLQVKALKDTLIRGNTPEALEKYTKEFNLHRQAFEQSLVKTQKLLSEHKQIIQKINSLLIMHKKMSESYLTEMSSFNINDPLSGKKIDVNVQGIDQPVFISLNSIITELEKQFQTHITEREELLDSHSEKTTTHSIILSIFSVFLLLTIAAWINRNVMRQLGGDPAYAASIVKTISEGNLTKIIKLKKGDNTSLLAQMDIMQNSLKDVIGKIRQSGDLIVSSSQQLAASSHQVSLSSIQQSDASATIAAAVEELTSGISDVSGNATQANNLSNEARKAALRGAQNIKNTIRDINAIATSMETTTVSIQQLGTQSDKIYSIINVISEIADQTNLLALNAAIEAARAGETGRGFAVVADEVRSLAEKTGQSTVEISETIAAIQKDTKSAISAMENNMKQMQPVISSADNAGHAMEDIETSTKKVLDALEEVSHILQEQSKASNEVSQSVETGARLNKENSEAVSEVSSAAQHLRDIAQNMIGSVQRFTI